MNWATWALVGVVVALHVGAAVAARRSQHPTIQRYWWVPLVPVIVGLVAGSAGAVLVLIAQASSE